MNTQAIKQKLEQLRVAMQEANLQAWIVPSADPHMSEYLPAHWQTRVWLSGFTGSVGTLVITAEEAGLWVDSRYWEQAKSQLAGTGISLQQLTTAETSHVAWLQTHLHSGARVGAAAEVLSLAEQERLTNALSPKGIDLVLDQDLCAPLWTDRPSLPDAQVYPQDIAFCHETSASKLSRVRQIMAQHGATHHLISALDDIAWLTNLRGADVNYNPVFLAHLLVSQTQATLFVNAERLNSASQQSLQQAGIATAPYTSVAEYLAKLPAESRLLLDPAKVAVETVRSLPKAVSVVRSMNPSTPLKAIKSQADIDCIKVAMVQDGIALCEAFAELDSLLAEGAPLTELDIDDMLLAARSRQANYVSLSFATIAGFNTNAAMPHYRATPENHAVIKGNGLLLIDSGAQYQNGTTDITRVFPVGTPSIAQIRDFTVVLKAHIAMARTCFPAGIAAPLIDAVGRAQLWAHQLDYGHGTGHGVGYFLNVHEGPQVLSYHAPIHAHSAMQAGMITSIEPGLYRPGKWGIRIENLVANVAVDAPEETEFGHYLRFESLTLCPIDTRLLEPSLLNDEEVSWLDAYHHQVWAQLSPHLRGKALAWLQERTMPFNQMV